MIQFEIDCPRMIRHGDGVVEDGQRYTVFFWVIFPPKRAQLVNLTFAPHSDNVDRVFKKMMCCQIKILYNMYIKHKFSI